MKITMQAAVDINYPEHPEEYNSVFSIFILPSENHVFIFAANGMQPVEKRINETMSFVLKRKRATRFDPEIVKEFGTMIEKELAEIIMNHEEDSDGCLRATGDGLRAWSVVSIALSRLNVSSFESGNFDLIKTSVETARKSMKRDRELTASLLKGGQKS